MRAFNFCGRVELEDAGDFDMRAPVNGNWASIEPLILGSMADAPH